MEPTPLSLTGKRWRWPVAPDDGVAIPGLPGWMNALLHRRGLSSADQVARYLEPTLASLEDPAGMADMGRALERLMRALDAREPITIYGDYDVDGVCATTVLVDFLRKLGADVRFYIPDRRSEGYGLNLAAVREIAQHSKVLVTVDCGITALAEVAAARELGLDVVIVDHHRVPAELPPAYAALNPQRPDCAFPFKGLCATGVAFMLTVALRRALRDRGFFETHAEPDVRDLLDVTALATVADMVPIRGTNRTLVAAGLKRLSVTKRLGLQALMHVAEVDPVAVTATDLGFRLGPRINARGRLSHAAEAVELLITQDAERARMLAAALDAANRERRLVEKHTVEQAVQRLEGGALDAQAVLVLEDPTWHPGVLGLVASRLVSRFQRPAVVIGEGGKGSARSIEGLNLHDAIATASEHLVRFGGHHAAAGVTIEPAHVPAFREALDAAVRAQVGAPPFIPTLDLDLEVAPESLSLAMVADLQKLAPFGQENPEPLLVARGVRARDRRVVGDGHLKMSVGGERGAPIDAIGFGLARLEGQLADATFDLAFRLERNTFRGRESVQLKIEDARLA